MTNTALYLTSSLVFGLTAGIAPGPLSALLVTHTLRHGLLAGIKVALAPIITDLPIIAVSLWLLSYLPQNPWPLGLISFIGGGYLAILSYGCFNVTPPSSTEPAAKAGSLRKGALVNLLNPHPYLFWMTVGTPLVLKMWPTSPATSAGWLIGFYITLVGAKIAMALLVSQAQQWLNGKGYRWLNRIMGVLLGLFAFALLREGLRLIGWMS